MSVVMTLHATANVKAIEEWAAANPDKLRTIADRAKEHGVIAHRFYGSGEDKIMVADEWPSEEQFRAFFAASPDIGEMMAEIGMQGQPEVTFWHVLQTNDHVGWGA